MWMGGERAGRRGAWVGGRALEDRGRWLLCLTLLARSSRPALFGAHCWVSAAPSALVRPRGTEVVVHGRPDGSLPPSPRWLNDDPYFVTRRASGLRCGERLRLDKRRQGVVDRLDELDAVVAAWMRDRREVLAEAEEIHESLWPPVEAGWGRRPPRPGRSPLAPQVAQPRAVRGAALRSLCLALLHRHGELAL